MKQTTIDALKSRIKQLEEENDRLRNSYHDLSNDNKECQTSRRRWYDRAKIMKEFVDIYALVDYTHACKSGHVVEDIDLRELITDISRSIKLVKNRRSDVDVKQIVCELESAVKNVRNLVGE